MFSYSCVDNHQNLKLPEFSYGCPVHYKNLKSNVNDRQNHNMADTLICEREYIMLDDRLLQISIM